MGKIRINSECLKGQEEQLQSITNMLQTIANDVTYCSVNLRWNISNSELVRKKLALYTQQVQKLSEKCSQLAGALGEGLQLYQETEKKLVNIENINTSSQSGETRDEKEETSTMSFADWLRIIFHKEHHEGSYEIDSIVFDDEGGYGGDQGSPQNQIGENRQALYDIVRRYYSNMTDAQIQDYLRKLNSEGCGYVAIINTIFRQYEGRESEFQEKFGFPMYKNGDLNYNELLVDFYTATDNHNKGLFWGDKINAKEDLSTTKGNGTNANSQKYRAQLYLKEKGIEVQIQTNKKVNVDNFQELAERGSIVINYRNGYLYDTNGQPHPVNGHSMIVTGVTEDGRYIVSSWGEKYYIDPKEIVSSNGKRTSYEFVYYQYE